MHKAAQIELPSVPGFFVHNAGTIVCCVMKIQCLQCVLKSTCIQKLTGWHQTKMHIIKCWQHRRRQKWDESIFRPWEMMLRPAPPHTWQRSFTVLTMTPNPQKKYVVDPLARQKEKCFDRVNKVNCSNQRSFGWREDWTLWMQQRTLRVQVQLQHEL